MIILRMFSKPIDVGDLIEITNPDGMNLPEEVIDFINADPGRSYMVDRPFNEVDGTISVFVNIGNHGGWWIGQKGYKVVAKKLRS